MKRHLKIQLYGAFTRNTSHSVHTGNQYIEEKILPLLIRGNIYAYVGKPKIGRILF